MRNGTFILVACQIGKGVERGFKFFVPGEKEIGGAMIRSFCILSALTFIGCANMGPRTELKPNEGSYEYIEDHGITKDSAFGKAAEWIAMNFRSANSVIQLQDRDAGKIVLKAAVPFTNVAYVNHCSYTLAVFVKDQKMKFAFDLGEILPGPNAPTWGGYPPESEMPDIESEFLRIKSSMLASIRARGKDEF
jgi:hypothetical protein